MAIATAAPVAGYKSTEFYAALVPMLSMVSGVLPERYAPMVVGLAVFYTACRTLLKAMHQSGMAVVAAVPDLPEIPADIQTVIDQRGSK